MDRIHSIQSDIQSSTFPIPSGLSSSSMACKVSGSLLANHLTSLTPPTQYLPPLPLDSSSSSISKAPLPAVHCRTNLQSAESTCWPEGTVSLNSEVSRKVRNGRTRRTCNKCKSRKQKCDFVRPFCGRCIHLGVECIYQSVVPVELKPREWHCPISGCFLSYRSRDSLGKHVRRNHPAVNTTGILDLAKQHRHEAKAAIAIDDDFRPHCSKVGAGKRRRRSIRDCDEYWPCMAPGCLKFFVSRHSLVNHRNKDHAHDDSVIPAHPSPKGTPYPMANQSLNPSRYLRPLPPVLSPQDGSSFLGYHAVPSSLYLNDLRNTHLSPSVLDSADRSR